MEMSFRERFTELWAKYFSGADLPLAIFYTDGDAGVALVDAEKSNRCLIGNLHRAVHGKPLRFGAESIGCPGGRRYAGFASELMPDFEYFLSCGIPGKLEGERYKKSPELVRELMATMRVLKAPKNHLVIKRWDLLTEEDAPEVIVFLATPDVLAGLFTLAGFDDDRDTAVHAPFAAGCATIIQFPYFERSSPRPRCVLGMFDVSARPFVPAGTLSFAVPIEKFHTMVDDMEESFLITSSWAKVQRRIAAHDEG